MSSRDKRNWIALLTFSFIFICGYSYGRASILEEFKYEIAKFSYQMNQAYDNLCLNVVAVQIRD